MISLIGPLRTGAAPSGLLRNTHSNTRTKHASHGADIAHYKASSTSECYLKC